MIENMLRRIREIALELNMGVTDVQRHDLCQELVDISVELLNA